jgi:hypothetical protein
MKPTYINQYHFSMKTKNLLLGGTILFLAASLSLAGCRKDRESEEANDTSAAEDHALAEITFEDLGQMADESSKGDVDNFSTNNTRGSESDAAGLLSLCAKVTIDSGINPKRITIDFGTSNCLCKDGRYRRGKIFITYSGKHYFDSAASINVTTTKAGDPGSDSYYVNDHHVVGSKSVTNKGHNKAGHMNWDIAVSGTITKPNGAGTITWSSTRNREWLAGEKTPLIRIDDSFGITGSANGTSSNGKSFNMQITTQLVRKMICPKHFVTGVFDLTPSNKPTRTVDFGYSPSPNAPGSCDSWVAITVNGKVFYKELN